jgi:hypothetical protein
MVRLSECRTIIPSHKPEKREMRIYGPDYKLPFFQRQPKYSTVNTIDVSFGQESYRIEYLGAIYLDCIAGTLMIAGASDDFILLAIGEMSLAPLMLRASAAYYRSMMGGNFTLADRIMGES